MKQITAIILAAVTFFGSLLWLTELAQAGPGAATAYADFASDESLNGPDGPLDSSALPLLEPVSQSERPTATLSSSLNDSQLELQSLPLTPAEAGDVLEVFINTWSYSTIGLVYDPGRNTVWYAHESQSSSHNPTIYEVGYPIAHTLLYSLALSTQNSGWPWQIDNRTGAGYDPVEETYFLPDYNGDLSYADDNIVEINAAGEILNAWEMDDEVGSNDSSDGSEIDSIIDIAIAPGPPTRYFATAAYDDNMVYEIELTRTGTWWTPNSWRTVATFTVPLLPNTDDNLGIDYDAQNGLLYHSSWDTTTIVISDLDGNEVDHFDCAGAGGYNSGVTFIEGASPPEVWVTDFSSDQTTRCQVMDEPAPPEAGWEKAVDGQPWTPELSVTAQLSDTIQATDVITAGRPFTLTVSWNADRLALAGLEVDPPLATITGTTGTLTVTGGEAAPEVITVTKQLLLRPSTWLSTTVSETLTVSNSEINREQRLFSVTKLAPQLTIGSLYEPEVLPGNVATFTLTYSNTGGYENDVWIRNEFPLTAPLLYADPAPDRRAADGSWAEWELGDLPQNINGSIDVYVYIDATLSPSTTITIWDGIYNHANQLADAVTTEFHVDSAAATGWEKYIDGVAWSPTISVTREVSETFMVEDVISTTQTFALSELWDPTKLELSAWTIEPPEYAALVDETVPGALIFGGTSSPPRPSGPITLTKEFTVKTCAWAQTLLWEQMVIGENLLFRAVPVNKIPSHLQIQGVNDQPDIYGGETVTYTLTYSNAGGYENEAFIRAELPPQISFVSSTPSATSGGPGDSIIEWALPAGLTTDQAGRLTVTVQIDEQIPPLTRLNIRNSIYDHAGIEQEVAVITYQVLPPIWEKRINGAVWDNDLVTLARQGDLITVTDVITTGSDFTLIDRWHVDHLILLGSAVSAGSRITGTNGLTWTVPMTRLEPVSITKQFQVITETYTVLWEHLRLGGEEWERRPVKIDASQPDILVLDGNSAIQNGAGSVGFGTTPQGVPVTKTFTISNSGVDTLVLGESSAGGGIPTGSEPIRVPPGFSVVSSFGRTDLPPGETTTFSIKLNAAVDGFYSGPVFFAHNDADDDPYSFWVSGRVGYFEYYFPLIFKESN